MAEDGGVKVLAEVNKVVLSTNREVVIRKVTLRTLPKVMEFLQGALTDLQGESVTLDGGLAPSTVLRLIANRLEATYDILVSLTDMSKDELLDGEMDDAVAIAVKVWEVNRDFFTQKIVPLLPTLAVAQAAKAEDQTGQ